jgi:FkbM family methyltransferase
MTIPEHVTYTPALDDSMCSRLFALGAHGGGRFMAPGELFESVISDIYTGTLRPGDLAVDGGANVGRHTFPMALAVKKAGMILAAEAIPALAKSLAKEARRRDLPQVRVIAKALYDRETTVEYHLVENNPHYSGIEARKYDFDAKVRRIPLATVTIDMLVRENNVWLNYLHRRRWRFCKLDLEGGELRALQGARKSLSRHRPLVVFENGQDLSARYYRYSKDEWFDFFDSLGYAVLTLWGRPFTREDWGRSDIPWYFIASPRNSDHEGFLAVKLPALLRNYLR